MCDYRNEFEIKEVRGKNIVCRIIRNGSYLALAIQWVDEEFWNRNDNYMYVASNAWEVISSNKPNLAWLHIGLFGKNLANNDRICVYDVGDISLAKQYAQEIEQAILEWDMLWEREKHGAMERR